MSTRTSGGPLISFVALLWGLQFAFLNPSIGLLLASLYDASPAEVGWALAAYNLSGFVSTMIVPARADRAGDYLTPMLGCGVLTLLLVTALAVSTTLPLAVLALVALGGPAGVGMGLLFAHQQATGASVVEVMRTRAVFSFSWVAGPPIATILLGVLGKRSVLWAVAGIAVICIWVTVLLRAQAREHRPGASSRSEEQASLTSILRTPQVAVLIVGFVLLYAANNASVSVTTLFVTDRLGLDVLWGGLALGVAAGLEVPFLLALGRLSQRFDPMLLLTAGAVAGIGYYLAVAFATGPVLLLGSQVLNAAFVAAISGAGLTVVQGIVPRPGLASGLYMNTYRVGAVASGPLIALGGVGSWGYATVFLACAAVALIGVLLLILARRIAIDPVAPVAGSPT